MNIFHPLNNERGGLFLIFLVITVVGGTTGILAIRVAQQEGQQYSNTLDNIAEGRPLTEQELDRARHSFHNQFRVLNGGGNIINAIDVAPDPGSVVSAYGSGAIGNYVDQASNPRRPTSDKPLPRCMSGTFTCANGKIICASVVCNGHDDCGDNSDERSTMCNTESSCCLSTNGCPGETGTSCAETCCCCPLNMICDRSNPANGCVRVQ